LLLDIVCHSTGSKLGASEDSDPERVGLSPLSVSDSDSEADLEDNGEPVYELNRSYQFQVL
jgi:hypothetical protein